MVCLGFVLFSFCLGPLGNCYLLIFLLLLLLTPPANSMGRYCTAINPWRKGDNAARKGSLLPATNFSLPTWFNCTHRGSPHDMEAAAGGEAEGDASSSPHCYAEIWSPEPDKTHLPPPLLPSTLTDIDTTQLCFGTLQRTKRGFKSRGKDRGTDTGSM